MGNSDINDEVIALLRHYLGKNVVVTSMTQLYQDLNIYGDDADEFLTAFSEKFGVDMNSFRFADYFPHEGMSPIDIVRIVARVFGHRDLSKKPLTVGHFVSVAKRKVWFDP